MINQACSLTREALSLVKAQKLINDFEVKSESDVQVILMGGERVAQTAENAIAFCRGLLEGIKITRQLMTPEGQTTDTLR